VNAVERDGEAVLFCDGGLGLPLGLSLLRCSKVKGIGSTHSPGLACLRVDNKNSLVVISGVAGLVSFPFAIICQGNNQHQADTEQEAKGKVFEVDVKVMFFKLHNDSSSKFVTESV